MQFKPFFINSNICLESRDISSFDTFMNAIAGNTGNAYITYALIKELCGGLKKINHIQNIYTYDFNNADKDIDTINNECSHCFLILQDQIRISESYGLQLPYENIINFIKRINKPIIIAGLGANSFNGFQSDFHKQLKPELIDFLKFLSDNCKQIGIRGHFTEEVLHNIGIKNVNVIGCPSFFEMGRDRIINKKSKINTESILLSSGFPLLMENNHLIMQDFCEGKFIKATGFNDFRDGFCDFEINKMMKKQYHVFSNISDWQKFISQFNFTIGYRLHGSICSLNVGVPAMCCNGDSRATEMCNYLKIPHNPNITQDTDIIKLYEELDYSELNNIYPQRYDNFEKFLNNNDLELFKGEIKNEIEQPSLLQYQCNNSFDTNLMLAQNYTHAQAANQELKNIIIDLQQKSNELSQQIAVITDIATKSLNETYVIKNNLQEYIGRPTFCQQIFSVRNEGGGGIRCFDC